MKPSNNPDGNDQPTSTPNEIDFVDGLLTPSTIPDTTDLRSQIYERTRPLLRRSRLWRRCRWVGSLVACYFAGILTIYFWPVSASKQVEAPYQEITAPDSPLPAIEQPLPLPSARDREWHAFESTQGQAEEYRKAGDVYLSEQRDLSAALRCYNAALESGGNDSLEINPDDSWLLMQIKNARLKEKNDAKNVR